MFLRDIHNFFFSSVEQIADIELKKIASEFFISRTGVEMIDIRKEIPHLGALPPIFDIYEKNRKSEQEYIKLDEKFEALRNESSSIKEYREKAVKNHYANCTMLACFMCDALIKNNINAKIFGIGGAHHFVIAQSDRPMDLLIIDPWAGKKFHIKLTEKINDLEDLSISSRLAICQAHFKETNLYPKEAYEKPLEEINELFQNASTSKDDYIKDTYSINSIERFVEFKNHPLDKSPVNDAVFENKKKTKT